MLELTKNGRLIPFGLGFRERHEKCDQMLQSRFEIQVSNFVGKQEKQTAQRPRVVVVTAFPFHYEITGKHDRGVADEHIKRTTLNLRSQLQVRFGKFEERLNAPTHAVDANDFSLFQR